jgi:hypothetical protein
MLDDGTLPAYRNPRAGVVQEEHMAEVTWHREFGGFRQHAVVPDSPDEGHYRLAICGKRAVMMETRGAQATLDRCKKCEMLLKPAAVQGTQAGLFGEEE